MVSDKSFGTCCACGKDDGHVRNFLALKLKAPERGTGWGCMVCRLPMDGAMAVVCDPCLIAGTKIHWVIKGPVWLGERMDKKFLMIPFDHKQGMHETESRKMYVN